jgi:hypothetical protein
MAVFNVRDCGAAGDGVADDTAAVQAAIDAASTSGGGVVYMPSGTYRVSASLTVHSRISIQGDGDQASVLYQTGATASALRGVDVAFLDLRNIQLKGPGTGSASGPGIYLSRSASPSCEGITMENVLVWQFGDSGIAISLPIVSTFTRVVSQQNGAHGFSLYGGGTSCALNACYANGNAQIGYSLGLVYSQFNGCAADSNGIAYHVTSSSRNLVFSACGAKDSINHNSTYDGTAWKIDGASNIVLDGCYAATASNRSFWVTGSAQAVTLISCTEASPGKGATASFEVDAGCSVTVIGWTYATPPSIAPGTATIVNGSAGNAAVPGMLSVAGKLAVGGTGMVRSTGNLTARLIVSGTTAETMVASLAIPANEAAAGSHYHLLAFGVLTAAGNPLLTPNIRWGGPGAVSLLSSFTAPAVPAGANVPWRMEGWVNFVSTTSCYAMLRFEYGTGATSVAIMDIPARAAITGLVTSRNTVLALTLRWGTAAANTLTVQGANIQRWA